MIAPSSATAPSVRLHAIRVKNFRGVRNLALNFAGQNAAIIGSNGTGKSSVADAVDFILTGQIRRLTGEGAQSLSLTKHGRHVDVQPDESWVEADIAVGGAPFTVRRDVAKPDTLQSDTALPDAVVRALALAEGGHHLLTRREILRYVFTEPSSRGQQVAALLQLTSVDALRKEIQGAARSAREAHQQQQAIRRTRERSLLQCCQPAALDRDAVLMSVNAARARLGAAPVGALAVPGLREGVAEPATVVTHPLATPRTTALAADVTRWLQSEGAAFTAAADEYLADVAALRTDPETLKALRAADLVDRGLALIPADLGVMADGPDGVATAQVGECPLCLREWDPAALRAMLAGRAAAARAARDKAAALRGRRETLQRTSAGIRTTVQSLAEAFASAPAAQFPATVAAAATCRSFQAALPRAATSLLPDPLDGSVADVAERTAAVAAFASEALTAALSASAAEAAARPPISEAQRDWDSLHAIAQALRECDAAEGELACAAQVASDLAKADALFVAARDEVLNGTYSAIAGRLQELYRLLHGPDEAGFSASLAPTKAGLKLEVDFYGRGEHPPCALHSEGHQDSLGLCFFLTLTEYLAGGPLPFVVLDDVLMSVDAGHRRAVADLLKREFPSCQFLITTHDRVWWRQLRSLGVVTGKRAFEFKSWTLEDGPVLHADPSALFHDVDQALAIGNVPGAAHALRRGVETILPDVCDAVGATVRYRGDGAWNAGEFLQAAMGRYNDLLGKARAAAQSWGATAVDWAAIDAAKKQAFAAYNAETWAVNVNVHFNVWADFTETDFRPVVDAYRSLFALFVCPDCAVPLRIVEEGADVTGLRCDCGRTNWNLKKKGI